MRTLGIAGMLGVVWFAGALLLLQAAASGGLDWTRHYVSQFANGPRGWLFAAGSLGHAAGNLLLGLGLYRSLRGGAMSAAAAVLFLLAASGFIVSGIFAADAPGAAPSVADAVHRTARSSAFESR